MYKKFYKNLHYKAKTGSKEKDELYYFDANLIRFWDKFKVSKPSCEDCEGNTIFTDICQLEKRYYMHKSWMQEQQIKSQQLEISALKTTLVIQDLCSKIDKLIK